MIVLVDYTEAALYFREKPIGEHGAWSTEAQALAERLQAMCDVDDRIEFTIRFGGPGLPFKLMLTLKARGKLHGMTVDLNSWAKTTPPYDPRMIAAALDGLVRSAMFEVGVRPVRLGRFKAGVSTFGVEVCPHCGELPPGNCPRGCL